MKTVWRRVLGPDTLGITTFEPGDRVKLKNPTPPYHISGQIKDVKSNTFNGAILTEARGFHVGDELIVQEIIPFDSRLFGSDDFYVCSHLKSGATIKVQRVFLDPIA